MDDALATAADETISAWPDVRRKQVFGHRGFVRNGKMFAFLAGDGLAVKAAGAAAKERLYALPGVHPFVYNGSMTMDGWPVLPLADGDGLAAALSAAQDALDSL